MGPLTDAHKLRYQANVDLAVQQLRSKTADAFTYVPDLSGRQSTMLELIGSTTAVINLGRRADTPDISNTIEPVWITPTQMAWGIIVELEDAIKAGTNYQSPLVQAGAGAMVRASDVIRSAAFFGNRKIGLDGVTLSAWAGQTVAVGVGHADGVTATGMNVKKLLRARRYLQAAQVDTGMEELFCGTNAQGIEELFNELTFISADFRTRKPLDDPEDVPILRIHIIALDGAANLADYDASTYTAVVWCKSGMHYGDFSPLTTAMPLRPDKMNRPHPQMEHWMGATRSEDVKVVKILNKK